MWFMPLQEISICFAEQWAEPAVWGGHHKGGTSGMPAFV